MKSIIFDEIDLEIIKIIGNIQPSNFKEIADIVNKPHPTVHDILERMVKFNVLKKVRLLTNKVGRPIELYYPSIKFDYCIEQINNGMEQIWLDKK